MEYENSYIKVRFQIIGVLSIKIDLALDEDRLKFWPATCEVSALGQVSLPF